MVLALVLGLLVDPLNFLAFAFDPFECAALTLASDVAYEFVALGRGLALAVTLVLTPTLFSVPDSASI